MKTEKKALITILCITIALPILQWLRLNELSVQKLSDNYFMFALIFIMIGSAIAILSSGAFDFFQKNMKNLRFSRRKDEQHDYVPLSKIVKKKPYYWFEVGITLLLISVLLLLIRPK